MDSDSKPDDDTETVSGDPSPIKPTPEPRREPDDKHREPDNRHQEPDDRKNKNPRLTPSGASEVARPAPRTHTTRGWRYTFSSLANGGFLRLWLSMLVMMSGMQMQMIARGYLVFELTGSAKVLALVSAAGSLPLLALGLFGGAIADRIERKRLIQTGQITNAALAIFIAVSIATGTVTWFHVLGVGIVQGATWAFMEPARMGLMRQLVGIDQVSNAMALSGAGMSASILLAPAIGGLLYAIIGPQGVYTVIAVMGLTAVILTSTLPRMSRVARQAKTTMRAEIMDGLSYIRRNTVVMVLLVMGMGTVMLAMPFKFMLPVYVTQVYNRESEAFGLLISMMGLGTLMGSLAIASLGRWKRGLLIIVATFLSGLALLLVALVPIFGAALGIMVVMGLGDAGRRVLNQALIMEQVEDQYQGRVMSVFNMNFGLVPLGIIPVGFAIDILGARETVGILGVMMLAAFALTLITQKRLRELD